MFEVQGRKQMQTAPVVCIGAHNPRSNPDLGAPVNSVSVILRWSSIYNTGCTFVPVYNHLHNVFSDHIKILALSALFHVRAPT